MIASRRLTFPSSAVLSATVVTNNGLDSCGVRLVSVNVAGAAAPAADATTGYDPARMFASAFAEPKPLASMIAVVGESEAVGPEARALNVTAPPAIGSPLGLAMDTRSGEANGVVTSVLWPSPEEMLRMKP